MKAFFLNTQTSDITKIPVFMGCCYSLAFNIAFKNDYTDVVYSNLKKKKK